MSTSLSPPKYVQALKEQDKAVLLEERLKDFITWLTTYHSYEIGPANGLYRLDDERVQELIREYVDT